MKFVAVMNKGSISGNNISTVTYDLRPTVKKLYKLHPKVSDSCVSYRDMTALPVQKTKRTGSAERDTTKITQTHKYRHHPTSNLSTCTTNTCT